MLAVAAAIPRSLPERQVVAQEAVASYAEDAPMTAAEKKAARMAAAAERRQAAEDKKKAATQAKIAAREAKEAAARAEVRVPLAPTPAPAPAPTPRAPHRWRRGLRSRGDSGLAERTY